MSAFTTVLVFTSNDVVDAHWPGDVLPLSIDGVERPPTRAPQQRVPDLLNLGCRELVSMTGTGGGLLLIRGSSRVDPEVVAWWTVAAQGCGLARGEWSVLEDARVAAYSVNEIEGGDLRKGQPCLALD